MSLHQDNAMPTAADDEFAALMAASSLRAPHVRALSDPIPDEAQSRLRETAEGPDAEQEPTACETQEATATADAGDDSEEEPPVSYRANNWQLPTLSRLLTEVYRHLAWIMDGDPGPSEHNVLVQHGRPMPAAGPPETARTTGILEWLRREPDHNRHYLLTHTGAALAPTLLPRETDHSPTYSNSSALLRLALSRWRGEPLLDARPGADFPDYRLACTSVGPSDSFAWAGPAFRFHTSCDEYATLRLVKESERYALNSGSRFRLHVLLNQTYESALAYYAARELGVNPRQFEQSVRTPGTADSTGTGAPAPALGTAGLTVGRLTDLLQPAHPPHLDPPRPHPSDGWTGYRISTMPDRIPARAWRPLFLSALTDSCAPGTTAEERLIIGEAALNSLIPQDTTSVIDAPLTPAHLLITTDSVVSLDQAHRHTIPEQVPPPFDVDAYTAQPGSLLLLPDTTSTAAGHEDSSEAANQTPGTGNPDKELTSEDSSSDPSEPPNPDCRTPKLWSTKTDDRGDGLEQCVQLWMRQHHTEGDHGDRILTQLVYRTKDPYAVTAVFHAGTEEELEWTFARELLADGLHTSVGLGDVIVWPGPEGPGDTQRIFIRLRPPGNTVLLSLDRDDVLEFLEATRPLPQNPSTKARTAVLASWERELRDLICPSPGE
ncbi:SsgA family sporulation/cell division regulator [Streptomyces sp. NPDC088719]|uniref:SsgA family sporulation/cell division regulator n=1 Tax=Streptomyces sp. NPDC088719 TaxID=3365872 RepID=UPI0037F1C5EA